MVFKLLIVILWWFIVAVLHPSSSNVVIVHQGLNKQVNGLAMLILTR